MKLSFHFIVILFSSLTCLSSKHISLLQSTSKMITSEEKNQLTLLGILYLSESNWTVWINQQKITNATLPNWLMIDHVSPRGIKGKWKHNDAWHAFELGVNESVPVSETTNP